jgi:hypothetical protein
MPTRMDLIRRELARLAKANGGRLTREAVVRAATPERSVLHGEFEWNDTRAAHRHRLDRAQELISYVTVMVVHKSMKIVSPVYVRDPSADQNKQGHVAITGPRLNRQAAQAIMLNELARCESAIERARSVTGVLDKSFPGLSDQLQAMLEEIVGLRTRLAEAA